MTNWSTGQVLVLIVFVLAVVLFLLTGLYKWYRNERMRKDPSYGAKQRGRHRVNVVRGTKENPYLVTNVRHTPRHRER